MDASQPQTADAKTKMPPLDEALQYVEYRKTTDATAAETAKAFNVLTKSGKLDAQRVAQMCRLYGPEISDAVRDKIRNGELGWTIILQRLAKGVDLEKGQKRRMAGRKPKPRFIEQATQYRKILLSETNLIISLTHNWNLEIKPTSLESVRFGMCLALGVDYVPLPEADQHNSVANAANERTLKQWLEVNQRIRKEDISGL